MSERRNPEDFIIEAFSEFEKLLIALNALVFFIGFFLPRSYMMKQKNFLPRSFSRSLKS